MESTPSPRSSWGLVGRTLLGLVVGASFGISIGALVASWVFGVDAIEGEAVNASYLAAAITVFGALVGAVIGFRAGSKANADGAASE